MRHYWIVTTLLILALLAMFGLVEALDIPLLSDPSPWIDQGGPLAAAIGVGLLIVDVVLPVPASLVMIAHGALFGLVPGALLSLVGSTGAALTGYAIGRRGNRLLARLVPAEERARADRLLARWGTLAIVATRPVPLLAEATVIMAGASSLGWKRVLVAAIAGAVPASLLYALTGAVAASFESGVLVFGLVVLIAAAFWWAGRRAGREGAVAESRVVEHDAGRMIP